MRKSKIFDACGLALLGLSYGAVVGLLAFKIAGAGHGWCSGSVSAWGALPLAVFGVALALDGRISRSVLLGISAVWLANIDVSLFDAAGQEDPEYLRKLWRVSGGFSYWLLWLLMWLGCQIYVLAMVVWEIGRIATLLLRAYVK